MYKNECDKRLVELTIYGDVLAFEELIIRHKKAVLGTAYKITHDHYKAEDVAQEAFVVAWIQLKALLSQNKFGAYVCAIAKNYAKKMVMGDYLIGTVSLTDFENWEFDNVNQTDTWYVANDDIYDRLYVEMESLSNTIKETIKLHYFDGLSVKNIATQLDIPEGTVKWRLSEGRKQLQKGFGVMDKKNQTVENPSLEARVMERIHELEVYKLKNNRQGMQDVYQKALESVEGVHDEQNKNYLLAAILYDGACYENPDMKNRWKQVILDGHNDMMMCHFTSWENHHLDGQEKIDFMNEVQIPFLKEHNFPLSVGYVYLMMAFEYFWEHRFEEALETVKQAKELLDPASVYYANAVSAVFAWSKMLAAPGSVPSTKGEHIKKINGSLYYCESPGIIFEDTRLRDFSRCDSCILDTGLALGESRVSSCSYVTYTFKDASATVATPAGVFENCYAYEIRGEYPGRNPVSSFSYYSTVYFCDGVGLVCQKVETNCCEGKESRCYQLTDYEIQGGEGLFPLYKGNRWAYNDVWNDTHTTKYDAYYEVTSWNGTDAMLAAEEIAYTPKKEEVSS